MVFIILVRTECLDGTKSKDDLYNQVYKDLQNTLLNKL